MRHSELSAEKPSSARRKTKPALNGSSGLARASEGRRGLPEALQTAFQALPEIFATRGRVAGLEALRDLLFTCHEALPLDRLVRLILDVDRQCLAAEIAQGREGRLRAEVTAWNDFREWLAAGDAALGAGEGGIDGQGSGSEEAELVEDVPA